MEIYKVENLTFSYPTKNEDALNGVSFSVKRGEFLTLCGKSGCGKTTLLRLMKSCLAPCGELSGRIEYCGQPLNKIGEDVQAGEIGFVMQSPENQLVTDKVWHELAFGPESLGWSNFEIRTRVAEMASFFGIQTWFHKKVTELSGGQKQLLNLAAVMVMQPQVLILDEPTSQLDPISAAEFIKTLEKINRELGVTVILSEHRLEEAFAVSDRVIVMDNGEIIADGKPEKIGEILGSMKHDMYCALPTPMRIHDAVECVSVSPITVRDGRRWLEEYSEAHGVDGSVVPCDKQSENGEISVEMKDVWFRYDKDLPDVIKGLDVKIMHGEVFAILGGNGTGKTTALSLMSGLNTPYRGEILINGESISKIKGLYKGVLGVLPQNPQSVFVKKTVYADLLEILSDEKTANDEKEKRVKDIAALCRIEKLLDSHPYDLSGGEQQRAALAKILLLSPKILLLDEPTKGLDAHFKLIFADILSELKKNGVTVVIVSHDIEFCAEFADRCAMFFDGAIASCGGPREFFGGNNFYTTAACRMARTTIPNAVLTEDVIAACGGIVKKREISSSGICIENRFEKSENKAEKNDGRISSFRRLIGIIFAVLFLVTTVIYAAKPNFAENGIVKASAWIEMIAAVILLFGKGEKSGVEVQVKKKDRKLPARTVVAAAMVLLAIPLTIYFGIYFLGDRKYYFISILIILETLVPFAMIFESRKPKARELVVISVLCGMAVAGRAAFFMLPQFKPVVALVIIAGVCFGGETGFLVGAVTGFVSNFFFGQGPWTPWQMFAFGIIGFLGGALFKKGILRKTRASLGIFGFLATLVIYGFVMNLSSVVTAQAVLNKEILLSYIVSGIPFDLIHAASTAFFLYVASDHMIEKLERIKIKYGLIE